MDLKEARIYVGTYGKYAGGSIAGAWLNLDAYESKDEFIEACLELHKDESDAELMFQDWENIPDGLTGESWLSENFFELRNEIAELSLGEQEAFWAWCEDCPYDILSESPHNLLEAFRECYLGCYESEEDFAYEFVEECYALEDFARSYFDYEKFARDLFMGDYHYADGYVFRNS